jgi:putative ubiquitin-RnfH superfamily antitoxin RatB of RatAB toxin-antitoxin module
MAPADGDVALMNIEVAYCPRPGVTDLVALRLAPGATLADALQASGLVARHALAPEGLRLGVWGKPRDALSALRERDRVEVYRSLSVDPKEARRLRYKRHRGATTAP